jgi:hypothetical protein
MLSQIQGEMEMVFKLCFHALKMIGNHGFPVFLQIFNKIFRTILALF